MNTSVLRAVFSRNFVSYFANPTGYVFICLFVLLSSVAAFWPHEFFNSNLANLDQLNWWFPFIMLVFIPAITMSIWADEVRQGTDELLLTIPAGDFEIVLGKYLAAVVIYTVALVFSFVTNLCVLSWLGDPDIGLFLGTYAGYWLVGLAMLATGMVASFLTGNLTLAFVLGAVFNMPLVFAAKSDVILRPAVAQFLNYWSISGQSADFGRGILSLASIIYFVTIIVAMLYLCMVLIARRHWVRGGDWVAMALHYLVRTVAILVIGIGITVFFHFHDVRADVTSEKLSSLSPHTIELLDQLKQEYDDGEIEQPVQIEAFISPEVPDTYVQARLNLLNVLRELDSRGGNLVNLRIRDTERFSPASVTAKERYDITPRVRASKNRGAYSEEHVFMGVAFTCGLEKVILPFIDRGIPAEYEMVRSLCTVTGQKRKRIGVLTTDAQLFGSFSMQGQTPDWPIVDELKKQYDVVRVNPSQPIAVKKPGEAASEEDDTFDVLLAVQPSSLGPPEMDNFIQAVREGQPTAIFEDPCTFLIRSVPATTEPKRPPQQMMMMQQQPMPKGEIKPLWQMLGINFSGDDGKQEIAFVPADERKQADRIVWQSYNPYPKVRMFDQDQEFVFVDEGCGASEPFNEDHDISSKLQQVLFPFPGFIRKTQTTEMEVVPLVTTGTNSGYVKLGEVFQSTLFGQSLNPYRPRDIEGKEYVLAAHITGKVKAEEDPADDATADGSEEDEAKKEKVNEVDVVLVSDIDMLTRPFFMLREQGDNAEAGVNFEFDNVTFILNVLDYLAGDDRLLELRKRRPKHRTLTRIEEATRDARKEMTKQREKYNKEAEEAIEEEQEKLDAMVEKYEKEIEDLSKQAQGGTEVRSRIIEIQQELDMQREAGQKRVDARREEAEREKEEKLEQIDAKLNTEIRRVQDGYKLWAVLLPPILPLLVAVIVFFTRRAQEREGVARSRLR